MKPTSKSTPNFELTLPRAEDHVDIDVISDNFEKIADEINTLASLGDPVTVDHGGTGATNAATARANLGVLASDGTAVNSEKLNDQPASYYQEANITLDDNAANTTLPTTSSGSLLSKIQAIRDNIKALFTYFTNGVANFAAKLSTARTLKVALDSTADVTFDGSANQTGIGVSGVLPTINGGTGNANGTIDKLTTARTLSVSGDATSNGVPFDGSANATIPITLNNSGVSAGTYKSVTVNSKGLITSGTNPTTISGYGITDAAPKSHASSDTDYGLSTTANYGHTRISDTYTSNQSLIANAASQTALYNTYKAAVLDRVTTADITKNVTLENIQTELNNLPKHLMHNVVFNFTSATNSARPDVKISGFYGNGTITLYGNTNTTIFKSLTIERCGNAGVIVQDVKVQQSSNGNAVHVNRCACPFVELLQIEAYTPSNSVAYNRAFNIIANSGVVRLNSCKAGRAEAGVFVQYSRVALTGSALTWVVAKNTYGLQLSYAAMIHLDIGVASDLGGENGGEKIHRSNTGNILVSNMNVII